MKFCPSCQQAKPFEKFHRDSKNKDGYSARCGACRNASRKKIVTKTFTVPINMVETEPSPKKCHCGRLLKPFDGESQTCPLGHKETNIPSSETNILDTILTKLDSYYVITVDRNRKCTLKKPGNPEQKWSARDPVELLSIVMSSVSLQ